MLSLPTCNFRRYLPFIQFLKMTENDAMKIIIRDLCEARW